MKSIVIAGLLAASTTIATAQPFEFQARIGSTEYDYIADTAHLGFPAVAESNRVSSLERWMLSANVDGIAPHAFEGEIVKSGPSRISLYEIMRGSSEGIAHRDYHERYPVGTDWDAIAREYRDNQRAKGIAAELSTADGDS